MATSVASVRRQEPPSTTPFPDLGRLYRREREIASFVYANGPVTAKQVQAALSDPISNPAVRSMLVRLVEKGVLTRLKGNFDGKYLYAPALTLLSAREISLKQFAQDYFDGSLPDVAKAMADLFAGPTARRCRTTPVGTRRI